MTNILLYLGLALIMTPVLYIFGTAFYIMQSNGGIPWEIQISVVGLILVIAALIIEYEGDLHGK